MISDGYCAALCLHSCFCTVSRAADNFSAHSGKNYWAIHGLFVAQWILFVALNAFAIWLVPEVYGVLYFALVFIPITGCAAAVSPFLVMWYVSAGIPAMFFARWRQQIRKTASGVEEQPGKCWKDWYLYCCCLPCAVAQDAILVDSKAGIKVESLF